MDEGGKHQKIPEKRTCSFSKDFEARFPDHLFLLERGSEWRGVCRLKAPKVLFSLDPEVIEIVHVEWIDDRESKRLSQAMSEAKAFAADYLA